MIKYFNSIYVISIHTPARGVTHSVHSIRLPKIYFNPHSRKGSDKVTISYTGLDGISIHTPARGVTLYNLPSYYSECISIHTPARGVTNARQKPVHFIVYFNPHSRKGSDL